MPDTQTEQTRINCGDVFSGVFATLRIRGYIGIQINRMTAVDSLAYDSACEAVYKRVRELCDERGDNCRFVIITHRFHGDSQKARDELWHWVSYRMMQLRSDGKGYFYFSINEDFANNVLEHAVNSTGYTKEIFDELTDLFVDVYGR